MSSLLVATANVPHRLLGHGLGHDMQRLANMGVAIIGTQESADNDWKQIQPHGWHHFRPSEARHGIVMWNPHEVHAVKMKAERISIAKSGNNVRYIVWVHFNTPIGPVRFGVVHLPAFYTSKAAQRREYDHQEPLAAKWLNGGKYRALVGDFNGRIPSKRTPNLSKMGRWTKQVPSGPHNAKIDYIGTAKRGPYKPTRTRMVAGGSDHKYVLADLVKR